MQKFNLKDFTRGWLIGNFEPSILRTENAELAIKKYKADFQEDPHFHKECDEITIIISGEVEINNIRYKENDIIMINKNEKAAFKAITDTITVVFREKSNPKDKFF